MSISPNGLRTDGFPQKLSYADATQLTYHDDIDRAASLLRSRISVLVSCDKAVSQHLLRHIPRQAGCSQPQVLTVPADPEPTDLESVDGHLAAMRGPRPLRQRYIAELRAMLQELKHDQILVIPHLDLLAGGPDNTLSPEAREVVELLFGPGGQDATERQDPTYDRVILAFIDRSLMIPEVLAARFQGRVTLTGIGKTVRHRDGTTQLSSEALIRADEAALFSGYEPEPMYKHLAGMNPVRLRQAMRFAYNQHNHGDRATVDDLIESLRQFKADTSSNFELPDEEFDDIGGYQEVKKEMKRVLRVMLDANAPEEVRRAIPRGFIFYGPPGTGKTLFAKAIANEMKATINVVSGPEVMTMWIGESERKVRELFEDARRNAPSVMVFDEFDSIAGKRSGLTDGGSRAGNAVVAQLLTELDGFRADVPMLIIATTNRLDQIDPALLRPSRFHAIEVELPREEERREIIEVCARRSNVAIPPALIDPLGAQFKGWNGDEIRAIFAKVAMAQYEARDREPKPHIVDIIGEIVGKVRRERRQLQSRVTGG